MGVVGLDALEVLGYSLGLLFGRSEGLGRLLLFNECLVIELLFLALLLFSQLFSL